MCQWIDYYHFVFDKFHLPLSKAKKNQHEAHYLVCPMEPAQPSFLVFEHPNCRDFVLRRVAVWHAGFYDY